MLYCTPVLFESGRLVRVDMEENLFRDSYMGNIFVRKKFSAGPGMFNRRSSSLFRPFR